MRYKLNVNDFPLIKPILDKLVDHNLNQSDLELILISFTKLGLILEALGFINIVLSLGFEISFNILCKIYEEAKKSQKSSISEGDIDLSEKIRDGINFILNSSYINNTFLGNSGFFLLRGHEALENFKNEEALAFYEKAIDLGNDYGLFYKAKVLNIIGRDNEALDILNKLVLKNHDKIFIQEIIKIYCIKGDYLNALKYYNILKFNINSNEITPFLFFSLKIENDLDLKVFEEFICNYFNGNDLLISDEVIKLIESAKKYIDSQINKERSIIKSNRLKLQSNQYTQLDYDQSNSSLLRIIYLMQVSIFSIKDKKYLDNYIGQLYNLFLNGGDEGIVLLTLYFQDNYSKEVIFEDDLKGNLDSETNPKISTSIALNNHLNKLVNIFSTYDFYDLNERMLIPFISELLDKIGKLDDETEELLESNLDVLKSKLNSFNSLFLDLKKIYFDFINKIDEKYGLTFRVNIQNYAIQNKEIPKKFHENIDLILLYYIEKMLSLTLTVKEQENIIEIYERYNLGENGPDEYFLFCSMVSNFSIEDSINFMYPYEGFLDDPYVIFTILELLLLLDEYERLELISKIDYFCEIEFSKNFFEYIKDNLDLLLKGEELDKNNLKYIYSSLGNIISLTNGKKEDAIASFQKAKGYDSHLGNLKLGDLYFGISDFQKAINFYNEAIDELIKINQISGVSKLLEKVLNCLFSNNSFKEAFDFISLWSNRGFNLLNYLFAYFILTGNYSEAFKLNLNHSGKIEINYLNKVIDKITLDYVSLKDSSVLLDNKSRIYISRMFILLMGGLNYFHSENSSLNIEFILSYWEQINLLLKKFSGDELFSEINSSLGVIFGTTDDLDNLIDSVKALNYVDMSACFVYDILKSELDLAKEVGKQEEIEFLIKTINNFVKSVNNFFIKMDNGEIFVEVWNIKYVF